MSNSNTEIQVVYLSREHLDDAIDVLSRALEQDPLMHFVFEKSDVDYLRSLAELFRFSCEVRFDLEWPLIGCTYDNNLVGIAGLSEPEDKPWPKSLIATYQKFKSVVGLEATDRLERYSELADSHRPEMPHFHIGVLGVHPEFQGRGIGGLIMRKIQAISESHPKSIGVAVDTENAVNVLFYERYGYSVVVKTEIDGMDLWSMFRNNRERRGEG